MTKGRKVFSPKESRRQKKRMSTVFSSLSFSCLPPQQQHVRAIKAFEPLHSERLWKSMWAIMMERAEGEGEKRGERGVPQGFWGPAKQLIGYKQHPSPHVQTFKMTACVMGSACPPWVHRAPAFTSHKFKEMRTQIQRLVRLWRFLHLTNVAECSSQRHRHTARSL